MNDKVTLQNAMARIDAMDASVVEAESTADHGRFDGLPVRVEWNVDDGRSGKLLAPITYFGADDGSWPVPTGAWLDGASIPQAFWSIIGGPYEGKYREPSVVHDHYCITKSCSWQDTHRMFHVAMLCRGVSGFKARVMFYAVYRFGPRWSAPSLAEGVPHVAALREPTEEEAASILQDAEIIRRTAADVPDIEALAEARR